MKHYVVVVAVFALGLGLTVTPAHADLHSISMIGDSFAPDSIDVHQHDVVRWTNLTSVTHTTTSGENGTPDGHWDSGPMAPNATYDVTFDTLDRYPYYCNYHWMLGMTGVVRVLLTDVGTQSIDQPADSVPVGSPQTPAATVKNHGSQAADFTVQCVITGGYTSSQSVTGLLKDVVKQVTFATWTPTTAGEHTMTVYTQLTGDENPHNDTLTKAIKVYVPNAIAEPPASPAGVRLDVAGPNPASARVVLDYGLAAAGPVRLDVLDATGAVVRSLVVGGRPAGRHAASWDLRDEVGRRVPDGLYFIRLATGARRVVVKLVTVRS